MTHGKNQGNPLRTHPPGARPAAVSGRPLLLILAAAVGVALLVVVIFGAMYAMRSDGAGEQMAATQPAGDGTGLTYYTCGMHPWVILPKPGLCPICHMDLTPIDPDKFTGEISIDPTTVQNIGVRIEPVTEGPLVQPPRPARCQGGRCFIRG